jgi:hypothetical protein
MKIDNFKFLSKKQVRIPNRFALLNPEDRNLFTQGYYDAFDCYNHSRSLESPYNPLVEEYKYELWREGVTFYEQNNNV